jgi:hypothetical protein
VASCRAAALDARARHDYETFHDLAWAAYRRGRANDPEAMLLVARAQSLSGRPGDAIVMIERILALGATTDAGTSDDFALVRTLPRWKEIAAKIETAAARGSAPPAPPTPERRQPDPKRSAPEPPAVKPPSADPPLKPRATDPPPEPPAKTTPPDRPAASGRTSSTTALPKRAPGAPLEFTTPLVPTALAYDAVSRRYIVADRQARRIAVVDENTGHAATFVGALGALGDIEGIAIDARQGDLWVISSHSSGPVLQRMQLISGRTLTEVRLDAFEGQIVAVAFVPGSGLVVADDSGTLWSLSPSGKPRRLTSLEYVPRGLAASADGQLLVAGGAPRLASFRLGPLRKTGVVELADGMSPDGPFAAAAGRLFAVVRRGGAFQIRSIPLK